MDLQKISLEPLQSKTIAILGYGNQGRAHALNLRDSGLSVVVGSRPGESFEQAKRDGFAPLSPREAVQKAEVLMFLFPDQVIPKVYAELADTFRHSKKFIGFCHGFAYHYRTIEILPGCSYFLVGPKGAGAILRDRFEKGEGLPGVYALGSTESDLLEVCLAYAKGIGVATNILIETTFQEETECDLFGEQAVLCGGIMQLMEAAFDTLTRHGHSPEMAFFECCFEARMILELWMKNGPRGLADRISPTAFFGGITRGRRLINGAVQAELEKIFHEIRNGEFAREWHHEVERGNPLSHAEKERLRSSPLQAAYDELKDKLNK